MIVEVTVAVTVETEGRKAGSRAKEIGNTSPTVEPCGRVTWLPNSNNDSAPIEKRIPTRNRCELRMLEPRISSPFEFNLWDLN